MRVNNEEFNNSAPTFIEIQNQMTIENHFLAQHNHDKSDVLAKTENHLLEVIKNEPDDTCNNVAINYNAPFKEIYVDSISRDKVENAEINGEIEIVKDELEYNQDDSEIKYDPLLFDDNGTQEKCIPSQSTNNYSDCNSTSSDGSQIDGVKNQNKTRTRQYKCDECPKRFYTKSHLESHCHTHTGDRPFKCTTCGKAFTRIGNLSRHKRTHTGEKSFTCDVCHKPFATKGNLTQHERMHNNVRMFKCSVCEKTFTHSSYVTIHMRIHTGEKPYQCRVCEYSCTRASSLKLHMRQHTGEKPYECTHCDHKFIDLRSLKKHIVTQHNDTN